MIESEFCKRCHRPYATKDFGICCSCLKDLECDFIKFGYLHVPWDEDEIDNYWLCWCGEFTDHCHCPTCKNEAPWGCDCGMQDELYGYDDDYDRPFYDPY